MIEKDLKEIVLIARAIDLDNLNHEDSKRLKGQCERIEELAIKYISKVEHSKPTPEERFLQLVEGSERISPALDPKKIKEYPCTACFWKKDGSVIIEEKKNGHVWIDYNKIWKVFYDEYDYNYDQVSELCKDMLEKHFNLRGCTPLNFLI